MSHEYAIKAGVLGVLGKCVVWPETTAPGPDRPLRIGIVGEDPFFENGLNQLDKIAGETAAAGGGFVVQRFAALADYEPCHILFVARSAASGADYDRLMELVHEQTKQAPVLLVGESPESIQHGAAASLVFDRATNLIRLQLNPDAAARVNLQLPPDLLRLSLVQIVREPPR